MMKIYIINFLITLLVNITFFSLNSNAQGYIGTSRYIGGSLAEYPPFIKIVNGETYLFGATSSTNFPITNAIAFGGGSFDFYVTKLDVNGNIIYSTYIGGNGDENPTSNIEVVNGEVLIGGFTTSTNYPVTNGSTYGGGQDIAVTKLNSSGAIVFSTYLGGSSTELPKFLKLINGEVFVFGHTSSPNFPVTNGSSASVNADIFFTKYSASGSIVFSTYIGGNNAEGLNHLNVENGIIYMTCNTSSTNFPVTNGSNNSGAEDIVLLKYTTSGTLLSSTYFGGTGQDYVNATRVVNGEVYIFARTSSPNFPVTNGSDLTGPYDLIVSKFNSNGSLIYSSYFGGSTSDNSTIGETSMEVLNGEVYFGGVSGSTNYPVTNGSFNSGAGDIVITKLSTTGVILFSSYYGGSAAETFGGLQVNNGEIYFTGYTTSLNYPVSNGSSFLGTYDYFATKINSSGAICFSTYIGGDGIENYANQIALYNGDFIIAGVSPSTNYPITLGSNMNGIQDIVITKFKFCPTFTVVSDPVIPATQTNCINGLNQTIIGSTISSPGNLLPTIYKAGIASLQNEIYPLYKWQQANALIGPWTDIPGAILKDYLPPASAINKYYQRIAYNSPCCGGALISTSNVASVLVNANSSPTANAGGFYNTCPSSAITIGGAPTATGGTAPYTYNWDFGAGTIANPSVAPAVNTIYTVIVTDALGCKNAAQALVNTHTANAGPDLSKCGSIPVRIGSLPIAGLVGVVYSWTAVPVDPTMSCSNCAQPNVNPSVVTTYTLTLTIPKSGGGTCITNDAVIVTPVGAPITPLFGGSDATLCLGNTTTLGTAAEAGFTYTWAPGNYLSSTSIAQPIFQAGNIEMPNPDPITYYVTAAKSGCNFVDSVKVFAIEARAGVDGCGPRLIGLPDRTPFVTGETYTWIKISGPGNFLGVTNLPQVPVSASIGSSTIYQLTVTYNGINCVDQVIVPPGCGCNVVITPTAINSCPSYSLNGGFVTLTASIPIGIDPSSLNFTWLPNVGLSNYNTQSVTLTDNIQRTYSVTITSKYDGSYSCGTSIAVNNPAWSIPVFTAQDVSTCAGSPVFIGQTNVVGYSYSWASTLGLSSYTISNPSATTSNTTEYPIIVTDVASGCTKKDTATVTVQPKANAGPDFIICSNAIIQLGTPALPNTTYSWSPAASPWRNGTNQTFAQPEVLIASNLQFIVTATNTIAGCITKDTVNVVVNNTPTIAAPDKTICFGNSTSIGVIPLPGVSYNWTPNIGLSCNNCAQLVASPISNQTYTVVGTYPGGCTATDNVLVTVSNPSFTIPDISYCPSGAAVPLAPTAPVGMTSYSWSPSNQVTNPAIANPSTLTPPPGSTTTYNLTVTNSLGCTASDNVTLIPTVTVPSAGNSRTQCLNSTTVLGASTNLATDVWTIVSGPNTSIAQLSCTICAQPVFTPTVTGDYVIRVSRTILGCTSNATLNVSVISFALPAIASPIVCQNTSVQLGTTPQAGAQYYWTPITGLSNPNIADPIATVGTTNKNYTLTAVGLNGCSSSANVFVAVNPFATPQITIPNILACLGEVGVNLSPTITPTGTYNYIWSPNNGTLSNIYLQNPSINISTLGTFQYNLTATNATNGCSNNASTNLSVFYCLFILPLKIEKFTAKPINEKVNIEWLINNEENIEKYTIEYSINGINFVSIGSIMANNLKNYSLIHNNPINGMNYYRLKIKYNNGVISFSNIDKVYFAKKSGIRIYPNPANTFINIMTPIEIINKYAIIKIITMDGKIVLQKVINKLGVNEQVNLDFITTGRYIVSILTDTSVYHNLLEINH